MFDVFGLVIEEYPKKHSMSANVVIAAQSTGYVVDGESYFLAQVINKDFDSGSASGVGQI